MKHIKVRKNLLLTVMTLFYVLLLSLYFISQNYINNHITTNSIEKLNSINNTLLLKKHAMMDDMKNSAFAIQKNKQLQNKWISEDKSLINEQWKNYFENFFAQSNLLLFRLIDKNGKIQYSLGNSQNKTICNSNYLLKRAIKLKKIMGGFEIDSLGVIAIKQIVPWFINGKIEGYMELGAEVEKIVGELYKVFNFEFILLARKDICKFTNNLYVGQNKNRKYFSLIKHTNLNIGEIDALLDTKEDFNKCRSKDKLLIAKLISVKDSESNEIAKMIIIDNYTKKKIQSSRTTTKIIYIIVVVGLLLFLFLYFYAGSIEKKLFEFNNKAISEGKLRELEQEAHIKQLQKEEERLKQSEEKLRIIFDNAKDAVIWANSKTGVITNCNIATKTLLEYNKEEIIGQSFQFIHPKDKAKYYFDKFKKNIAVSGAVDDDAEVITKGGKIKYVNISASIISVGNETIIQGVFRDITIRKEALQNLEESEARLRAVSENSIDAIFWADGETSLITDCNKAAETLLEMSKNEIIGLKQIEVHPKNKQAEYQKRFTQQLVEHGYLDIEAEIETKVGKIKFVHITASITIVAGKSIVHGTFHDITKRKLNEQLVKKSEQLFKLVAEYSNSIVWEIDSKNQYTYLNSVVERLLGYKVEELLGKDAFIHFPNTKENIRGLKIIETILKKNGKYSNQEFMMTHKNGNTIWINSSGADILNSKGKVIGRRGISTDITQKKKYEQKLKESEEKNRSILEALPDMIFVFDKNGVFLDYHVANNNKLEIPAEKFLGKNIDEVFPKNIADITKENITKTLSNNEMNVFRYSSTIEEKVFNEEARMVKYSKNYVLAMVRDISDIIVAENKLIEAKERAERADKLKSTFLAQMSHEIRTPINSIVSLSSLVEEELIEHADDDLKSCFSLIQKSGDRIIRTTDLILNLSEIEAGTYEVRNEEFNLTDEVLRKLFIEYLTVANRKNIEVKMELTLQNPIITADSYTIEQIFRNLIDNAIKYTNKGKITIKAFEDKKSKKVVEISDTGIGILEDYLPKLFTPFTQEEMGYTRKYEGNGVGLALVKKFCELNNALIEVESKKGVGSTFRVII